MRMAHTIMYICCKSFCKKNEEKFACVKIISYLCTAFQRKGLKKINFGVLVQLVRIHACHAWGHGFESRTHRKKLPTLHSEM